MTTAAQDAIIKQLEDRYDEIRCTPLYADGQTEGHADYQIVARLEYDHTCTERKLVINPAGSIVYDKEREVDQDDADH